MNATSLNGKTVRFNGNVYRLIAASLFGKLLLSADCVYGPNKGQSINNLNADRTKVGRGLKNSIKLGLVS